MNPEQLQQQYDEARNEVLTLTSRNVDPATLNTAVTRALSLKTKLEAAQGAANFSAALNRNTSGITNGRADGGLGLGAQFVASSTFRWLRDTKSTRSGIWNAPASELVGTTMFNAAITGDPASGGALVVPDYRGLVVPPLRPTLIADLLAPGSTESNLVKYPRESGYTNSAAAVAEGGAKPESTIAFVEQSEPVRKIAHWVPVSEEMFEDVPLISSYLDLRLRAGVEQAVDQQLLNGDGVAPNLAGILARPGLGAPIARVDPEVNADVILRQIGQLQAATNIAPDGIVLHPAQWQTILLTKDSQGQYYGNGPFAGPQKPTLWGLEVAVSTVILPGTCLVGSFKGAAQLLNRGNLRVEASNSHQDFFTRNLVAVLAERRLALAVYFPAAFGLCTNLN